MASITAGGRTSLLRRLEPDISRHLLRDEGEDIVDEVEKHWIVYVRPFAEILLAAVLLGMVAVLPTNLGWVPFLLAVGLLVHAVWLALKPVGWPWGMVLPPRRWPARSPSNCAHDRLSWPMRV